MTDRYPNADWLGNGRPGGSWVDAPYRIVVHTTETVGIPGYRDGASAPHLTYHPAKRRFVQHTSFEHAARALRNPAGGVQTNRQRALQLEIVAYSNQRLAAQHPSRMWVGDLTLEHLADIGGWFRWCADTFNVVLSWRLKPHQDSKCYGDDSPCRMTATEWTRFNGICDHAQVPENTHWDAGAFDFQTALDYAGGTAPLPIDPPKETDDMFCTYRDGFGTDNGDPTVAYWQHVLKDDLGIELGSVDGKYGDLTVAAVQEAIGGTGRTIGPPEAAEINRAVRAHQAGALEDHRHTIVLPSRTGGVAPE